MIEKFPIEEKCKVFASKDATMLPKDTSTWQRTKPFPTVFDTNPIALDLSKPYVIRFLNCTTNKPLHLGHLRNMVLGDATANTLRTLGVNAVKHCIFEDTGRFMTEAMVAIREAKAASKTISAGEIKSDHFVGACYASFRKKLTALHTAKNSKEATTKRATTKAATIKGATTKGAQAKGTPAIAGTTYDAANDDADKVMRALLNNDEAALQLRKEVREMALEGQQITLQRLGISFDYCDFESVEDADIANFVANCELRGFVYRNNKGEKVWKAKNGTVLRLVNSAGLFEESTRLLSFNARIAKTEASAYRTIVFAGSEWKASMTTYAEFLSEFGERLFEGYVPTFYGMVNHKGKKMASSDGSGVLVDTLLDSLATDERLQTLADRSVNRASPAHLAVMVVRAFLLSTPRTEAVEYSVERVGMAETNLGWAIATAWGMLHERQLSPCSPDCQRLLLEAAKYRSFDICLRQGSRIAEKIIDHSQNEVEENDFRTLVRAMSLYPWLTDFDYSTTTSFAFAPAGT